MSTRILLSDEREDESYWDAQLVDYKDFAALADDDSILWGDHIHIYADEPYLAEILRETDAAFRQIELDRKWSAQNDRFNRSVALMTFADPNLAPNSRVWQDAITDFTVHDDNSWHCPDENGVPCQFFKDGTRRYA